MKITSAIIVIRSWGQVLLVDTSSSSSSLYSSSSVSTHLRVRVDHVLRFHAHGELSAQLSTTHNTSTSAHQHIRKSAHHITSLHHHVSTSLHINLY